MKDALTISCYISFTACRESRDRLQPFVAIALTMALIDLRARVSGRVPDRV